jgi:hypothetical protein
MIGDGAHNLGQADHVENCNRVQGHIENLALDRPLEFIGLMLLLPKRPDDLFYLYPLFFIIGTEIEPGLFDHAAELFDRLDNRIDQQEKIFFQLGRDTGFGTEGDPVQRVFDGIQDTILLAQLTKQLKLAHRHEGAHGEMAPDAAFDRICLALQANDLLPQFFKRLTTFGHVTFDCLLKGPGTFFDLFGVFLQPFKG